MREKFYCCNLSGRLHNGYRCFEEVDIGITCKQHAKSNLSTEQRLLQLKKVVKCLIKLLKNPGTKIYHKNHGAGIESELIKLLREIDIRDLC